MVVVVKEAEAEVAAASWWWLLLLPFDATRLIVWTSSMRGEVSEWEGQECRDGDDAT